MKRDRRDHTHLRVVSAAAPDPVVALIEHASAGDLDALVEAAAEYGLLSAAMRRHALSLVDDRRLTRGARLCIAEVVRDHDLTTLGELLEAPALWGEIDRRLTEDEHDDLIEVICSRILEDALDEVERPSPEQAASSPMEMDAAEAALLARPAPEDQNLARVHADVLECYRELREELPPPGVNPRPWEGSEVHLQEGLIVVRTNAPDGTFPVRIGLPSAVQGVTLHCPHCEHAYRSPYGGWHRRADLRDGSSCIHVFAAARRLLDMLTREVEADAHRRLLDALATPPWRRLVDRLAGLLPGGGDGETRPEAQARIAWRVSRTPDAGYALEPVLQRVAKRGGFTKGRAIRWNTFLTEAGAHGHAGDRRVAARLSSIGRFVGEDGLHYAADQVLGAAALIGELEGHPNVVLEDGESTRPVSVRRGEAELALRHDEDGGYRVDLVAGRDRARVEAILEQTSHGRRVFDAHAPAEGLSAIVPSEDGACLTVVDLSPAAVGILGLFGEHGGHVEDEAAEALLDHLDRLEEVLPLRLDDRLKGAPHPADPTPVVLVTADAVGGARVGIRFQPAPGGRRHPPGEGPAEAYGEVDGARVHVTRDPQAEVAAARALVDALSNDPETGAPIPLADDGRWTLTCDGLETVLALVSRLSALARDGAVRVIWEKPAPAVTRAATAADLRVRATRRRDWFGLDGEVTVDGLAVPLAAVLGAARDGRRFVEVAGKGFVALGQGLRRQLALAADLSRDGRKGPEIAAGTAWLLEDLARDAHRFDAPGAFHEIAARAKAAREADPALPDGLKATLRHYQADGFRWLARLSALGAGGILADDMGLGKTVQALALLFHRADEGPALVVAPTSVCTNWAREAERFAPGLCVHLYRDHDAGGRASLLSGLGPNDVLVTSWGLLARDHEAFAETHFATVVFDEAQTAKNAATRRARAARDLSADVRVALTGTPIENHVGELWSILRLVFPPLLGSWDRFRERFARPIESGDEVTSKARRQDLARLVRPFVLRRTKDEVAPELPPRTEIVVPVTLSRAERSVYEALRLAALSSLKSGGGEGNGDARFAILAALTRLRLAACHPKLADRASRTASSKLERLMEIVGDLCAEGHRALVFSQFTEHLALVREALDARGMDYLYLDGSTPAARRDALVDAFQGGERALFLISLKAGGTGLNLTAADYVIHLDPWWNPAVEDQATDRSHRIGQTRPVTVLRLVSEGTIEEEVLALHEEKRRLVGDVLEGAGEAARMSTDALLGLLSGERAWVSEDERVP